MSQELQKTQVIQIHTTYNDLSLNNDKKLLYSISNEPENELKIINDFQINNYLNHFTEDLLTEDDFNFTNYKIKFTDDNSKIIFTYYVIIYEENNEFIMELLSNHDVDNNLINLVEISSNQVKKVKKELKLFNLVETEIKNINEYLILIKNDNFYFVEIDGEMKTIKDLKYFSIPTRYNYYDVKKEPIIKLNLELFFNEYFKSTLNETNLNVMVDFEMMNKNIYHCNVNVEYFNENDAKVIIQAIFKLNVIENQNVI